MNLVDDEDESENSIRIIARNDAKEGGEDDGSIQLLENNELDVSLKISDVLGLDEENSIESSLGSSYQEPLMDDCEPSETESGRPSGLSSQLWEVSSTESSLVSGESELLEDEASVSLVDDEDDFEASLQSAVFFKCSDSADSADRVLSKITEHSRESFRSQEDPSYHLKSRTLSAKDCAQLRLSSPIKSPRLSGSRPRSSDSMENRISEIHFISSEPYGEDNCEKSVDALADPS
jgi:hypothetical protein